MCTDNAIKALLLTYLRQLSDICAAGTGSLGWCIAESTHLPSVSFTRRVTSGRKKKSACSSSTGSGNLATT